MTTRPADLLDAFLNEALAEDAAALATLDVLPGGLRAVAPDPAVRARLMASATPTGRFARFAATLAGLIDLTVDAARALLDGFELDPGWEPGPLPAGSASLWVGGGPATAGCIRGFIRLTAGSTFPDHTHLGEESVLVLQGAMFDHESRSVSRPGDVVTLAAGSRHGFSVPPGGPDLLYFVVVRDGVELGGQVIRPRDDTSF